MKFNTIRSIKGTVALAESSWLSFVGSCISKGNKNATQKGFHIGGAAGRHCDHRDSNWDDLSSGRCCSQRCSVNSMQVKLATDGNLPVGKSLKQPER